MSAKERPFDWFGKAHKRHARNGRYRDVVYLDRYYNSAMDRFVKKTGTSKNGLNFKDLYRSTYANEKLTPPHKYLFDVEKAKLVKERPAQQGEIIHNGLIYRGERLMQEFMPTSMERAPPPTPASGRITIEAVLYGNKHPRRGESRLGEAASKKLTIFGAPKAWHGGNRIVNENVLMRGEQVALRELTQVTFSVSEADYRGFKREPQENRIYLLNDDDYIYFFKMAEKDGKKLNESGMYKVIKTLSVTRSEGEPRSDLNELLQ